MTDAIVPIGHKSIVQRYAVATGILEISEDSADAIRNGQVAKGDVLEAVSYTHLTLPTKA